MMIRNWIRYIWVLIMFCTVSVYSTSIPAQDVWFTMDVQLDPESLPPGLVYSPKTRVIDNPTDTPFYFVAVVNPPMDWIGTLPDTVSPIDELLSGQLPRNIMPYFKLVSGQKYCHKQDKMNNESWGTCQKYRPFDLERESQRYNDSLYRYRNKWDKKLPRNRSHFRISQQAYIIALDILWANPDFRLATDEYNQFSKRPVDVEPPKPQPFTMLAYYGQEEWQLRGQIIYALNIGYYYHDYESDMPDY